MIQTPTYSGKVVYNGQWLPFTVKANSQQQACEIALASYPKGATIGVCSRTSL